jgi:hypothetical protein
MIFNISFTPEADQDLSLLEKDHSKKVELKAVRKAIGYLQSDPHHKSLQTHQYHTQSGPNGEKVFEAYAQQNRPCAYRVYWYYGPERGEITIATIMPHPK